MLVNLNSFAVRLHPHVHLMSTISFTWWMFQTVAIFAIILLLCILVNSNWRSNNGVGLGMRLFPIHTHLNCVIPGKQVQTHFVDDLILQVGKNRKMKVVLCKVLLWPTDSLWSHSPALTYSSGNLLFTGHYELGRGPAELRDRVKSAYICQPQTAGLIDFLLIL